MPQSGQPLILLHLLGGADLPRRRFPLAAGTFTVGSRSDCDVYLPTEGVSRRHASLEVLADGGVLLEDLGSRNGTTVGGRRIQRVALSGDALLGFGPVEAQVVPLQGPLSAIVMSTSVPGRPSTEPPPVGLPRPDDTPTEGASALERVLSVTLTALDQDAAGPGQGDRRALAVASAWATVLHARHVEIGCRHHDGAWTIVAAAGELPGPGTEAPLSVFSGALGARIWGGDDTWLPRLRPALELALRALASSPGAETSAPWRPSRRGDRLDLPPPGTLNPSVLELYRQAGKVAGGEVPMLLTGPSGSGKEVLARWVHDHSPRAGGPFVVINCTALPRDLLEAELFGIERGVATGVEARPGLIEQADGGSLLLDEIADMALETQAKILRVLDDQGFHRVGGRKLESVSVRFLAATNRPIGELVAAGKFRKDLYHRLAAFVAELPGLSARREDIPLLVSYFVQEQLARSGRSSPGVTRGALAALVDYPWPGSIRELRHQIAAAVLLLEPGEPLSIEHLSPDVRAALDGSPPGPPLGLEHAVHRAEREAFQVALSTAGGDPAVARRLLGVGKTTYYRKLKELGLER